MSPVFDPPEAHPRMERDAPRVPMLKSGRRAQPASRAALKRGSRQPWTRASTVAPSWR